MEQFQYFQSSYLVFIQVTYKTRCQCPDNLQDDFEQSSLLKNESGSTVDKKKISPPPPKTWTAFIIRGETKMRIFECANVYRTV